MKRKILIIVLFILILFVIFSGIHMAKYEMIECDNNVISFLPEFNITISPNDNKTYLIKYNVNQNVYEEKISGKSNLFIKLEKNKNNIVSINVISDNTIIEKKEIHIFEVENYQHQFAERVSMNGVQTHYINGTGEDFEKDKELLFNLGAMIIRDDFISKDSGLDTEKYNWVNKVNERKIKILALAYHNGKFVDEKDMNNYLKFIEDIENKFPFITDYEIMNEANFTFRNQEDVNSYGKALNLIKKDSKLKKININPTGTSMPDQNQSFVITSEDFYKYLYNTGIYDSINSISYHGYGNNRIDRNKKYVNNYFNMNNDFGGFNYVNTTEYGSSMYYAKNNEEIQAEDLVKQTIIYDNFSRIKTLYSFWTLDNSDNTGNHFGLLTHDYIPRKSYYSMKNFYTNTNGAEYIGNLNLASGVDSHVYDKDGKPKIIIWSTDDGESIDIDYTGFTAEDLYGNEISNTNGKLTITNSPIYLDNLSTKYFYQAISNSITDGYKEFNTKFANEIAKVNDLSNRITDLNNQASALKDIEKIDENNANQLIKNHFDLGNMILYAYKDRKLNIEYIKLSSMLNYLETIGDSYEDLIIVSAKTRMNDLSKINNELNKAKSLAKDNENIKIVYPNKIYKFAQDLLDTSFYVLGLQEENEIKTGLINAKALHAYYLAKWSQEFSKIYIQDTLKNSVNTIIEKNEEIKTSNQNLFSNNELSSTYSKLKNSLQNLLNMPENNNIGAINIIFDDQIKLLHTILEKYNSKEISISEDTLYNIIYKELESLNNYSDLYKYYLKEDNINSKDVGNKLNKIINKYNENIDIDLNNESTLINNLKNIYENKINTENISDNYLYKEIINNESDLISKLIENKIKNTADNEFNSIKLIADNDTTDFTNQDINISLKLPNDKSIITNNENKNTIKFEKNGEFTFHISIRGYDYNYKVSVSNIDKVAPKLEIVLTDNKLSVKAEDDNLKELCIEKEGRKIDNCNLITEPGIYKIIANDKANNQTVSKAFIYDIYDENNQKKKYIPIEKSETKVKEIKENSSFTIKENGQDAEDDTLIKTGDTLVKDYQEYTLVVKGDLTKTGSVGVTDLIKLRRQLVSLEDLKIIDKIAADLNNDKRVSIVDLVKIRKKIIGAE